MIPDLSLSGGADGVTALLMLQLFPVSEALTRVKNLYKFFFIAVQF